MKDDLGLFEYAGNMHVHSIHSDGSGTVADIAGYADKAGLDFVCMNDHNTLIGQALAEGGYYGKVLVLIGMEANWEKNHYLAYGIRKVPPVNDDNPQEVIDDVKAQGGTGFIAHPFEKGSPYVLGGRTYCWTDWSVEGFDGIEVWNMLSQWRDSMSTIPKALRYGLISPGHALKGPNSEALRVFDDRCQKGHVALVAGSDCHAIRLGPGAAKFTFGSYGYSFRCVNMHILTSEPLRGNTIAEGDRARLRGGKEHSGRREDNGLSNMPVYGDDCTVLTRALGNGSGYAALHLLGDARGFRFWAEGPRGRADMGNRYRSLGTGLPNLWYRLPKNAGRCRIKVIRDGQPYWSSDSVRDSGKIVLDGMGVYRIEILKSKGFGYRTWILGNPIWIS